jgi:hypothetical protein
MAGWSCGAGQARKADWYLLKALLANRQESARDAGWKRQRPSLSGTVTFCPNWPGIEIERTGRLASAQVTRLSGQFASRARKRRGYALTVSVGPDDVVGIPRLLSTSLTLRPVVAAITDGLPPCCAIWANWERCTMSSISRAVVPGTCAGCC